MPSKAENDKLYMQLAQSYANMSKAIRAKVGAILVTNTGVVIPGYNGTPSGTDNSCEYIDPETGEIITHPYVIHAELNCILKCAKEGISAIDSVLYVTHAPCIRCAAMLKQAGIREVIYKEKYRDCSGVDYLSINNVTVRMFEE